jgi:RimJ/RimL family protein N-acetyltransferase
MDPLADRTVLPTLSTERLRLRALRPSDAPALFAIFSDAAVTQYWGHGQMQAMDEAEAFVTQTDEGFRTRELLEWGITWAEADDVIGTAAFAGWDQEHRRAEIGFALRRDCWGQGLMTEVLPPFLAFGFETLGLHRIEADVDPRNVASIRLLERHGFRREGRLRERYLNDGEAQDALFYGLLRSEASFLDRPEQ